jgi:hypothetical protein
MTSKTLRTSLRLLARGYWVIAIYPKGATKLDGKSTSKDGKDPIGRDWGVERWTEERLRAAHERYPTAGAGICFGPCRGPDGEWLVDLEGDGSGAAESMVTVMGGAIPETLAWRSTRGDHVVFIADGERLLSLLTAAGAKEEQGLRAGVWHLPEVPGLEWRVGGYKADGTTIKQVQSVVPPTPGTDGKPRWWRVTPRTPPAPLPESAYTLLERIAAAKRAGAARPAPQPEATIRSDDPHDHQAVLRRACDEFGGAPMGSRHATLLRWSLPLAARVKGGVLSERDVVDGLYAAARDNGMKEQGRVHEVDEALRSAMVMADPWTVRSSSDRPAAVRPAAPSRNGPAAGTVTVPPDPPIVLPEWPAPPGPAAYGGLAGEIVRTIELESEADPAALLVQLLIAFGSVVGRRAYVAVGAARHYSNEFAVMVGETSAGRKGTSWSDVRQFIASADPDWHNGRILGGLSSGEGLIYAVRDQLEGQVPVKEKGRIVDYQTAIIDPGVSDKRLLVFESEFGGVLKALGRDGNKLSAVIRQAWDGDTLASLTKGSPHRATDAHISIVAHITADELTQLLTTCDQANGFANRMLWVCCKRSKLLPYGGSLAQEVVARLQTNVADAIAFAKGIDAVGWTRGAKDLWEATYPRLTAPRPGVFGRITSRAEAHAVRLALLYAVLDRSREIKPDHLRAALALWDYCERSARYIFGDALGDKDAQAILDALRAAPEGLTRHQIRRDVFNGHRSGPEIASKVAMLLQRGLVRSEMVATDGRPAEHWFAVAPCAISAISAESSATPDPLGANGAYGARRSDDGAASADFEEGEI